MPSIIVSTIGPDEDFATLANWAASLPPDLTAVDEIHIAELMDTAEDPGNVVIATICDAERYVIVRAAAGMSVADVSDPATSPLRIEPGQGALVRAVSGDAISLGSTTTRAEVHGLQIEAQNGVALNDFGGQFTRVSGCIFAGNTLDAVVKVRGVGSQISACAVIQRGSGDGVKLISGAHAEGLTIFKPERPIADGYGLVAAGSPDADVERTAAFGFGQAFGPGIATASALASDQLNELTAPDDLSDATWTRVSASIDPADTIVGPNGIPLQKVGNNLNGFSFFSAEPLPALPPGERIAFSMIVSDVTAIISALLLDSTIGKPEMRVDWTATPPSVAILGATAVLQTIEGSLTDLGGGAYRMFLEAENTSVAPIDVTPIFYVTRGVENVGLDVGMYAGSAMAGAGNLGNGFVYQGALPGSDAVEGLDPESVLISAEAGLPDLRPVPGTDLELQAGSDLASGTDIYRRYRENPETIGAVALNADAGALPSPLTVPAKLDSVHAFDEREILAAYRARTVLPASPARVVNP
ncbi:MAG: hypothetical protein AAGD13_05100 [Pseudomonadota bacterium]